MQGLLWHSATPVGGSPLIPAVSHKTDKAHHTEDAEVNGGRDHHVAVDSLKFAVTFRKTRLARSSVHQALSNQPYAFCTLVC